MNREEDGSFSFTSYLTSQEMEKPQLHFSTPVQNDSSSFLPFLKEKPNALEELHIEGSEVKQNMFLLEDYARQIGVDIANCELHGYLNPYTYEINRFLSLVLSRRYRLPSRRRQASRRAASGDPRRLLGDSRRHRGLADESSDDAASQPRHRLRPARAPLPQLPGLPLRHRRTFPPFLPSRSPRTPRTSSWTRRRYTTRCRG